MILDNSFSDLGLASQSNREEPIFDSAILVTVLDTKSKVTDIVLRRKSSNYSPTKLIFYH